MNPSGVWNVFVPYSGLHALAVAVCALLIAAPALVGRRLLKNGEPALRRALAALVVCYWLADSIWWNWNGLDLLNGLPLQLCDVNGLIAPLALVTGWRWARAALYFWTAALTVQAFIQPALTAGPASLVFWSFWTAHTIIAACAVYDVVVRGFRPGLGRSRPRHRGQRHLCGSGRAGQSTARLELRIRRKSGRHQRHSAVRLCARAVAVARDHPGRAGAARLCRRAVAVADRRPARAVGPARRGQDEFRLNRHARACRGHPRLQMPRQNKDVDGRDKPGHDEDVRSMSTHPCLGYRISYDPSRLAGAEAKAPARNHRSPRQCRSAARRRAATARCRLALEIPASRSSARRR
jgi:hypothetical protein